MNALDPAKALSQQSLITLIENMSIASDNQALSLAGLTQGSGVNTKVKVANTVTYTCSGKLYSKTTAEVAFTTTTDDIPANAASIQERVYMVTVNAAGTLAIVAGTIATGAGAALLPERPADGTTPIGYLRITVAAGATPFTANTTQPVTAGAITAVYQDGYPRPRFSAAQ